VELMARGMVVGEAITSQANTKEFADGYERTFGDRKPQRGRWVWDEQARKLVPADEYVAPERAVDAPILSGRFYENTATTDGVDIGSRQKHRAYMRDRGLAPADDFSPGYYERIRKQSQEQHRKERREAIARRLYEIDKP
jgi:hypothetical protein